MQGRGDGQRRQRGGEDIGAVFLAQQAGFEHALGQLFHEQRYAVGLGNDLIEHLGRQRLTRHDAIDHRYRLTSLETVEREGGDMRTPDPWRGELRPGCHHIQHGQVLHSVDDPAEQIERCGIDPVRVFNQHQQRHGFRKSDHQRDHRCNGPLLLFAWSHFERRIPPVGRDRQQRRQIRRDLAAFETRA